MAATNSVCYFLIRNVLLSWCIIGNIKLGNLKSEFEDEERAGWRHKATGALSWQRFQFAAGPSAVQPRREGRQPLTARLNNSHADSAFTPHFYRGSTQTEAEYNNCFEQQSPLHGFRQAPVRRSEEETEPLKSEGV